MNNNKKGLGRGLGALLSIFDDEEEVQTPAPQFETKPTPPPATQSMVTEEPILPNPYADFSAPTPPPTPTQPAPTPAPTPTLNSAGVPIFVNGLGEVPIEQIEVNPNQPRKYFDETALRELCESIKIHGIIQPIVVTEVVPGRYMIIAGERRYRASKMAGLATMPCVLKDFTERQVKEVSLIENLQRENLNPIEAAMAVKQLMDEYNFTQEVVAERIGKSRPSVTNMLRLLNLTPEVRKFVEQGLLLPGQARPMVVLDPAMQIKVAKTVIDKNLNARETEKLVKEVLKPKEATPEKQLEQSTELINFTQELERVFSTKVSIQGDDNKGRISINYFSKDDLDRIFDLIELIKNKNLTLRDLSNFNKHN
ncbi:MAG: ParB/RepB/Spo0J family partition protein [Clostridia bacterium]